MCVLVQSSMCHYIKNASSFTRIGSSPLSVCGKAGLFNLCNRRRVNPDLTDWVMYCLLGKQLNKAQIFELMCTHCAFKLRWYVPVLFMYVLLFSEKYYIDLGRKDCSEIFRSLRIRPKVNNQWNKRGHIFKKWNL